MKTEKQVTKQQYGRTWWGQQWLRALDRIDFDNRLERGRSYARKGAVLDMQVNDNQIEARVKGSRPKPYSVNIVVPPFFEEQRNVFLNALKNKPLIISRLLNRELPQELFTIAEENKIKLFPQSWQDIKLNCNCPDWAVPCKHLAAVIYMVANEIDQNPFLVFKLHQFDLPGELKKMKVKIEGLESEQIAGFEDAILKGKLQNKGRSLMPPNKEVPDFSLIPDLRQIVPTLFISNNLFYSGNFSAKIQDVYKRAAARETGSLKSKKQSEVSGYEEMRYADFKIIYLANGKIIPEAHLKQRIYNLALDKLLVLLAQTESKHLENYSDSFQLLYRTFRFCNILVERSCILPRLFRYEKEGYKIHWIPALMNEQVRLVFDQLKQWVVPDLVYTAASEKTKVTDNQVLNYEQEVLQLICSLFMNQSIKAVVDEVKQVTLKNATDAKIQAMFFENELVRFSHFSEKEIPNSIQLWLKRFFITNKALIPLIQVYELEKEGFEVEVLIKQKGTKVEAVESLYSFLKDGNDDRKMQVLKDLNLLSDYYPDLNRIIESEGRKKLLYTSNSLSEVLRKVLPALDMFGIQALLPRSLKNILYPKLTLSLKSNPKNKSYFSLDNLVSFQWKVAVGDTYITRSEFEKMAGRTLGLVKIRDQYMMLDEGEVKKIIHALENPKTPETFQLLQAALAGEYENAPVQIDDKLKKDLQELLKEEEVAVPASLLASLRPYQYRGFSWMYKNAKLGLGSVLADDMGLGKTLQVITTILKFKEEGHLKKQAVLVIVPTTLLSNWVNEIIKFAPQLTVNTYHGSARKLEKKMPDVLLTTYGVARSEAKKLKSRDWYAVIVDEAQNIKNPNVLQTKNIKTIQANIRIAMSGTPVENRLSEYWSIFDFANPGYLGGLNWFDQHYARPIEINQDRHKLESFKKITAPFIMRRVKSDKKIISDLPDKVENNQYCALTVEQAALYKNVTKDLMEMVEQTEGIERRGLVLKLLMVLKQICNHPAQYLKDKNTHPELSGKIQMLFQLLENIYENNEKVLIFTQFQEMAVILQEVIYNRFQKDALLLHGGCSRKQRDEMVSAFQNEKMEDTFILSLKAGGTGLNLTAASNVIHFDLWWNPAVEAQATDRAFRIGQKKNVMVHRMITRGTLEEKIDDMINSKKKLAGLTVAQGEKWLGDMSDKDLKDLIAMKV